MRSLSAIFLKGLAAVLPVALTLYLLLWLGTTAESILGQWLRLAIPEHRYWPGLGFVVGVLWLVLKFALGAIKLGIDEAQARIAPPAPPATPTAALPAPEAEGS